MLIFSGTAAASADPDALANLQWWLDAGAGAFTDAGVTLATDGQTVQEWHDQSGNGHDGSQATSSRRPTYRATGGPNSQPALEFVAADSERLDFASFFGANQDGEIFVVVKVNADPAADSSSSGLWRIGGSATPTAYPNTSGDIVDSFGSTVTRTFNPSASLASWHLLNIAASGSEWTCRINGTQEFTTATNNQAWSSSPQIGGRSASSVFLDGRIAELVMYSAVLSAGDRDSLEAYFAAKYGLTIA